MQSQPSIWSGFVSIYRTVAVVDLVAYSTLARVLEENSSAAAVAELNRKIQELIEQALAPLGCDAYTLIAKTGDGALILFDDPACAHSFAVNLHQCAATHNLGRSEKTAKRFFRIGLASGEITVSSPDSSQPEYAGITIANAVRLESAAEPGEVLADLATYIALPPELQSSYSKEFSVRGKRDETFRVRKWSISGRPATPIGGSFLSRRRVLTLGFGATAALGLGGWRFGGQRVSYWLHPLPRQRFVALAAWPEPEADIRAVTREVLSSARQALQRLESLDRSFLLVDVDPSADAASVEHAAPFEPARQFGANLVLVAASRLSGSHLHLALQVMDIKTREVYRHTNLSSSRDDLSALRASIVPAAAALLDLPSELSPLDDEEEIRRMPQRAYQLFAEGKALVSDFNGAHRAEGIAKLQELVNTYPNFSVGFGQLATAYVEDFRTSRDPAMLELAATNARQALKINPDSAMACLSSARVLVSKGKPDEALAYVKKLLTIDPHDPEALFYRAVVYRRKGDAAGEVQAYRQILDSRPNYWRAYNDLGRAEEDRANYKEAVRAFSMASHLAPGLSLPLTNLGTAYFSLGDTAHARTAYEHSVTIFPTADAYSGLGSLAFDDKDYHRALDAYKKAQVLEPRSHDILRDIGDCQTMLGESQLARRTFQAAAELVRDELKVDSSKANSWMILSLYHAKIGAFDEARSDLASAEQRGALNLDSQFIKAQTLAVLNRNEEAIDLVLHCISSGLSTKDVDLAVDLIPITHDPRYVARVNALHL